MAHLQLEREDETHPATGASCGEHAGSAGLLSRAPGSFVTWAGGFPLACKASCVHHLQHLLCCPSSGLLSAWFLS